MPAAQLAMLGLGAAQSLIGGINARKAQRELERMQSPVYKQNKGILDFYDKALQRYQTPATESSFYKKQMQDIGRGTAQGISALTDRGSAVGGISRLIQGQNDATLNANVAAEQMRDQRFSELGGATQMKAGEDRLAYQYNELAPFERSYNLKAMKAAGNNQTTNAGISNIFGGLNSIGQFDMIKKMYGGNAGSDAFNEGPQRTRIPIERQTTISRRYQ